VPCNRPRPQPFNSLRIQFSRLPSHLIPGYITFSVVNIFQFWVHIVPI